MHDANLELTYRPSHLTMRDTGLAIEVSYAEGSGMRIGGSWYDLQQFHMHSPAEHTFSGQRSSMELHLVHGDHEGRLAVVAVRYDPGAANPALEQVSTRLPGDHGDPETSEGVLIDAEQLLPDVRRYVTYEGSLTAPPYTEGVRWFVLTQTAEASAEQLDALSQRHPINARPAQPLNGRSFD